MRKRIAIILLTFVGILCIGICGCVNESKNQTKDSLFSGFTDSTIDVFYGEFFSIEEFLKAYDENGKAYSVAAIVKDSAGNRISLLKNSFTVTDATGYTIELSLLDEDNGSILKTRNVTVVTKDNPAPFITIGNVVETAVIGDTINVPLSFISKSDNFTSIVKVERLNFDTALQDYKETGAESVDCDYRSKDEEVTFIVNKSGRYKVTVSAHNGTEKAQDTFVREKSVYIDVISIPTANEIESFETPASKFSAYSVNVQGNPSKGYLNTTGVWHPQFEGRYGVLEIKPSKYTAKTSNNSAKDGYHLQSSFRDESFYATNESWDYVSVWVYVEGAENEEVTMSTSWYNTCKTTVKCNEWVEYRLNKTGALNVSVLNGIKSQEVIAKWLAYRINGSTAPLLAIDTESESIGNRKIYIDSISYDKAITFKASGKAETGSSITLTASATGNISEGFEYSVKKPGSKDYEGISGNTFVPTEAGVYEFKATRIIDGVKRSEIIEIVIGASNAIESFDSESSVNAAYGLNAKGNPDKNSLNATAVWHSEYSGKQGVLELQPSGYYSSSSAKRDLYHLKSSFRDGTYYADNDDWDYISIWLYVEGTENEEVKISVSLYGSCQVTVKCNEWVEFRIDKERARSLSSSSTYVDQSGATVSGKNQQTLAYWMSKEENSITLRAPLIAIDTASTEKTTRKIFVDKISYEKNHK